MLRTMMKTFVSAVASILTLAGVNCAAHDSLAVGDALPSAEVVDENGDKFNLADYAGKPYVLVYFYPKADTPGCTAQACSLRDEYAGLTDSGVTVFGVSTDGPKDQKAFKEKYDLPFTLIADERGKLAHTFGVPLRGSFAARQAFLFKNGELVWRDDQASTRKQADDVKAVLAKNAATSDS